MNGSNRVYSHAARVTLLGLALALPSCAGDQPSAGLTWTTSIDTVDGVPHLTNHPPQGGGGVTHEGLEVLRLGSIEGEGPTAFQVIRELAVLSDGRIAVADGQAEEIRLFARDGTHLDTFGGRGAGPGELMGLQGVHVYRGVLRAPELSNARMSVFHPDSGFVTSYPFRLHTHGRGPLSMGIDSDDRMHLVSSGQHDGGWWHMIRVYDAEMVQVDSIPYEDYTNAFDQDERPGYWKVAYPGGSDQWDRVPFFAESHEVLKPNGEFLATVGGTRYLEVVQFAPAGDTTLIFTSRREPRPVTSAEMDSALTARRAEYEERGAKVMGFGASKIPDTKPSHYGVSLDDQLRLWVRLTPATAEPTVYDVFDQYGRYEMTVRLPFRVDRWVPPVGRGDTVWAVAKDALDLQYVVRSELSEVLDDGAIEWVGR